MSDTIKIGFKRLHTYADVPTYAHSGDAGLDICLPSTIPPLVPGEIRIIPCGFSCEIPTGYELQIRSRSGLASKGIVVANSPGTVDAGFKGEIGVILKNMSPAIQPLEKGMKIAQMVPNKVPKIEWELVDELSFSERGDGGFGSSGLNSE